MSIRQQFISKPSKALTKRLNIAILFLFIYQSTAKAKKCSNPYSKCGAFLSKLDVCIYAAKTHLMKAFALGICTELPVSIREI